MVKRYFDSIDITDWKEKDIGKRIDKETKAGKKFYISIQKNKKYLILHWREEWEWIGT